MSATQTSEAVQAAPLDRSDFSPNQVVAVDKAEEWLNGKEPKLFTLLGPAGTGKCLGVDTPVMLACGKVIPVQDVEASMQLMGPDSEPRKVLSTARGRGPLYRVTPTKGDPWVCNDAHILTLTGTNEQMGKTIDVSVQDILKRKHWYKINWKLFRVPTKFPKRAAPSFDPYLFGVWLGDGTKNLPHITNCETEIIEYCKAVAPSHGLCAVVTPDPKHNTYTIRFRVDSDLDCTDNFSLSRNGRLDNPMTLLVRQGKRIHPCYLYGSEEVRMEILAGLLDTDGHLDGGGFEITQKSDGLAKDILFIARSLGFAAYLTKKVATIKSIGFEGEYNRVYISGDVSRIPCKVPRRQAVPRKQIKRVLVTGFKLEPIGQGDYYGFELNRDGRFLLGDFTVTHNTTLAKYIALLANGPVWFLAPTGKAALVMRQAGCIGAQTVHSAIYTPQERSKVRLAEIERDLAQMGSDAPQAERDELLRQLKVERENAERPMFNLKSDCDIINAALVIVDEASMIDKTMGEDLLSFDVPILALGDPAQLPPIRGSGYFMDNKVGHLLTEIHRQAKNSPIIQLATTVRTGGRLEVGQYGNCAVTKENTKELALAADQIIVGLNKTRRWVNARVRELKGFSGPPQPGEKLVCGRNNKHEPALLNGSLWEVVECDAGEETCFLTIKPFQLPGPEIGCLAHMHWFEGREEQLQWYEKLDANQFDFGYAITAHKSQGSQWPNVLIIDESSTFKHDAAKHLYTAITRAQKQVTVII